MTIVLPKPVTSPRGAVSKSVFERAYEPRDYIPSWHQIHEFLGLGGGTGEQPVAAGSNSHTVGEVALE